MKKKITIAFVLLLVLAAALSITAHAAEPPQAAIGSTISITDITPRENIENDGENANS